MKIFGYTLTVLVIIVVAPIIVLMMDSGDPGLRTYGILILFVFAGIFCGIQKLIEWNKNPPA